MRAPLSWLREFAALPPGATGREVANALIRIGLEVETVDVAGAGISGPLVIGRVISIEELTEFRKPIRYCQVQCAPDGDPRGIVCGARNFGAGDQVVVALPGATLPGGFQITARETYGKISDGMICSERELGLGDDQTGILRLPPDTAPPGSPAGPVLGLGEEILDIAVTPDRGYALSIRGVAREAATAYSVAFRDPGLRLADLPDPDPEGPPPRGCSTADPAGCDLITIRTLTGLDQSRPTPAWLRRRLIDCGTRPVSLIVDVTNYVMLETGQPLHAFDLAKVRGPLVARRAEPGERLTTLDHVDRALDPDDLVIADDAGPLALAGTMGGLASEVDADSTGIALEAAHFTATVVARMSRRHKLSSEASRRFERGVDPALAAFASARAAALLLELGGGEHRGIAAAGEPREPAVIAMAATAPGALAGLRIAPTECVRLLEAVGCSVSGPAADDAIEVLPPSWRPDLRDPADLCEEVLRLVGYDRIPATLPAAVGGRGLTRAQQLRRGVARAITGAGFAEVLAYPFVGNADWDRCQLPAGDARRTAIRLVNPLSDEQPYLRTSLLPGLLATARRNLARGADGVSLVEIGSVYRPAAAPAPGALGAPAVRPPADRRPTESELAALDERLPDQPCQLAVVLAGVREPRGWWGPERKGLWAEAVEAARTVARAAGAELQVARGADPQFHPGRCAHLRLDGATVGVAGELQPRLVEAWGLPDRSCAMELDLDAVIEAARNVAAAPEVATMPVAKEDIALVASRDLPVAELSAVLKAAAGPLLESVRLFDEYTGPQVGAHERSLAFALRFRAPDRTLSIEEVSELRDKAVAAAAAAFGVRLRS